MTRITIFQPHPECPPDRLAEWLPDVDCGTVRLWEEPVPQASSWGDGAVVLGGPLSAHDAARHPGIGDLAEGLREAVGAGLPVLAICLGHQILAAALGGRVSVGDRRSRERGAQSIVLLDSCACDPVLGRLHESTALGDGGVIAYQCHDDAVAELPAGATLLASSQACPVQAFRLGNALGVQFHPEATPERMLMWRARDGMADPGFIRGIEAVDPRVAASGSLIVRAFAAQCAAHERVAV